MTSMQSEISDSLPSFHDAKLSGFILLPAQRCSLFIETESKQSHRVVLLGVERLRADDFREGNIILDLTVHGGKSVEKADVLFALSMDDEKRHPDFFNSIMERIHRGELSLLQINPSYGCVFSCLCSGWRIESWDTMTER
jgi:hypothetical protein